MNRTQKLARLAFRAAQPRLKFAGTSPDDAPIFIIGSGRSGNTLVRRVLVASDQVFIPPETYVLGDIVETWAASRFLPWRHRVWLFCAHFEKHLHFGTFGLENLDGFAREMADRPACGLSELIDAFYRHLARQSGSAATRWGDKTPWNTDHLPALGAVFPAARYLWLVRDGRDVALSYVRAGLIDGLPAAAERWTRANIACAAFARWCPNLRQLHYEDLVRDPESAFADIMGWAGLQFSPAMLTTQPGDMGDVEAHAHHARVRGAISADSVGKWRTGLSASDLAALPPAFWAQMKRLGYDGAPGDRGSQPDNRDRAKA